MARPGAAALVSVPGFIWLLRAVPESRPGRGWVAARLATTHLRGTLLPLVDDLAVLGGGVAGQRHGLADGAKARAAARAACICSAESQRRTSL